jgi:hypothetical protein
MVLLVLVGCSVSSSGFEVGEPVRWDIDCSGQDFVAENVEVVQPLLEAIAFWASQGETVGNIGEEGIFVRVGPEDLEPDHLGETRIWPGRCEIVLRDPSVGGVVAHEVGHTLGFKDVESPGIMNKYLEGALR